MPESFPVIVVDVVAVDVAVAVVGTIAFRYIVPGCLKLVLAAAQNQPDTAPIVKSHL
jgi:hypothetical protein